LTTNINFPQAPFLDPNTQKPSLPWLLWLQNPTFGSVQSANAISSISGGTGSKSIPENGQVLVGSNNAYVPANLNAGNGIAINNQTSSITIANTGQESFSAGTTGFTPINSTTGAVTLGGTLNLAHGGTGATTAPQARINLGLGGGLSVTITTAKLTTLGSNGSMTFTNGILTAQTQAT